MPTGVYERTPEMNAAALRGREESGMYDRMRGIPRTPEVKVAISKSLADYDTTPEHCAAISKGLMGHDTADETKKKISGALISAWKEHPETHVEAIKDMCGGDDICNHHYIYDESDLSKYTMKMTRSAHARLHWLMKKANIIVPHINIKEVL